MVEVVVRFVSGFQAAMVVMGDSMRFTTTLLPGMSSFFLFAGASNNESDSLIVELTTRCCS